MLRPMCCLLALVIVPSLARAQATPPPSVRGNKIDPVKADPMPQGIMDPLLFRGAPTQWRPPPVDKDLAPIKGLSPADKLALVRRAAGRGGVSAAGSSMRPFMTLSRATMRTPFGKVEFAGARLVTNEITVIGARGTGEVYFRVIPDDPRRLYLVELQLASTTTATACLLRGPGGSEQTFRLSGAALTIVPAVFESASRDYHEFGITCDQQWQFNSVEVTILR